MRELRHSNWLETRGRLSPVILWGGLAVTSGLAVIATCFLWYPGTRSSAAGSDLEHRQVGGPSIDPNRLVQRSPLESIGALGVDSDRAASGLLRGLTSILESIGAEPDSVSRTARMARFVGEIPAQEIPGVVEALQSEPASGTRHQLTQELLRRWARDEPMAAARFVEGINATERADSVREVARTWADQDFSQALEWVRQLPDSAGREGALLSLAAEAIRTQPATALNLAAELSPNPARDDLIAHAAAEWTAKDPEAASKWAQGIANTKLRDSTLVGIATAWAESDPIAAANLAVGSLTTGRNQDDAIVGIVERWAQREPEAAARWVLDFPQPLLRDTALKEVVKLWTDQNPQTAADWLNGLSHGVSRDTAISAYATKLAPEFPESATEWAEQIDNSELRGSVLAALQKL